MNSEEFEALHAETWSNKTFDEFRVEAECEASGMAFKSMQLSDGPQLVLIVCITGESQVEGVCRALGIALPNRSLTWASVTLGELVTAAVRGSRPVVEAQYDDEGHPTAMILGTIDPRSIKILVDRFGFIDPLLKECE